ncbi:CsgG/HfaB family protein [Candidatus Neomarinimicrobiota bacterium]
MNCRLTDNRSGRAVIFFVSTILSVTCLLPTHTFAQPKQSIAVMDLEGRGISTIEAATLTDRMRTELVNTGAVTVVERGQMQSILSEQDFQMTGCTSDECAVQIGQVLGVTMIYTGSIGKIGSTYTVDVRTIDVQTGAITGTMSRDYRGEIDGLIREIERLSWDLVGLVHPDELLEQLQAGPGMELNDVTQQPAVEPATREQPPPTTPAPAAREAKPRKKGRLFAAAVIVGGGAAAWYFLLGPGSEEPPANVDILVNLNP